MVMRQMRENTKWIMLVATLAFIAWLVLDWVQSGQGAQGAGANPVVAVVNGEEIRYTEWNRFLQGRLDQVRQQAQGALTDEQLHQAREQAWEQLINQTLVQQELDRLGLQATESEIRAAFRNAPPPQLRNHPAFQTNGQFDYQKYRDFFSGPGVNQQLLLQIESYYRETLPRIKLEQLISDEVTVTEADLRRAWTEQNETATVRFVSLAPGQLVPDSAVEVTDEAIRSYYREHRDEFRRPPTAVVDLVSLEAEPSAEDSASARARVDSLRSVIEGEGTSFADVVEQISEGSASGMRAASLSEVERGELIPSLEEAVFSAPVGRVVGPVKSPSGFHLIEVRSRQGEAASFDQVLVPVQLSTRGEDRLFARMDTLEGVALREGLEAAADSLGLPLRNDVRLEEGAEFVPGAGALGVAVSWAFAGDTRVGDLSQFFENASGYHLLELEERLEEGMRPLDEVRGEIRRRLASERRAEQARQILAAAVDSLGPDETLEALARRRGWEVSRAGPFTRNEFVQGLGRRTPAVGAAFGLEPGAVAGPLDAGGQRLALVELVERSSPDPGAFTAVEGQLRRQLENQMRQQHVQRWLQALREEAEVRDLRDQLDQGQSAQAS